MPALFVNMTMTIVALYLVKHFTIMYKTITATASAFALAAILSLSIGCKKEDNNRKAFEQVYNCHNESSPTIENVSTRLNGLWWMYQSESYGSKTQVYTPEIEIYVKFNTDSTYSLTEDGKETVTGTWAVEKNDRGEFSLNLSTTTTYTYGVIYICTDRVIFSNGHLDGPTYYFSRVSK